jgi:DNA-binding PadR family transcriptional regulator
VASPKELAPEVGETVGNMAYHIRKLEESGYVEPVRTEPRRGAEEHFYRATKAAVFTAEEWALVPRSFQARIVGMQSRATGKMQSRSLERAFGLPGTKKPRCCRASRSTATAFRP